VQLINFIGVLFWVPQSFAGSGLQSWKTNIAFSATLSFSVQAWDLWSTAKHCCQFCCL